MIRTRNFRVPNEIMERGSATKSQKRKKAFVERKVGECFQWNAKGQCSKGDSCSFSHDPASAAASGNGCETHRANGRSSSPAPRSKAKTDAEGETPSKFSGNRGESPSDKMNRLACRHRKYNTPSCNYWHAPVCQNYKSETGCKKIRHVDTGKAHQEVKERWCERISCLDDGVQTFGLCVSRFLSEKIYVEKENSDQVTPSNSPRARAPKKNSGKKGPSRRIIQKCEPHERSPCAPGFEERSQESLHQEIGENCLQAQECGQSYVLLSH